MSLADASVDVLQRLAQPDSAPLLAALHDLRDEPSANVIQRLRADWPAPLVAAAVEVQLARWRAAGRFGARAATLWADREGLEMASAPAAAAWKARRLAGREGVVDLCCGIGGDLMHLAAACPATGVDRSAARAWMAERNAGVTVRVGDACETPLGAPFVHADPARRGGGRRLHTADELEPSLDALRAATAGARGVCIKLGPGMDLEPPHVGPEDEREFIAEHGTLTQQALWTGELALHPGGTSATLACEGLTLHGAPGATPCRGDARWARMLAVPSPALERARLVHLVAGHAAEPAPGLGVLTADEIPASPWLERHGVVATLPAREREVAAWLRAHGGGVPVVRTRGKACDPDAWLAALRSPGDARHWVWVLRVGSERNAVVTQPA